mmetsp:Transcript_17009/g.54057  ORF Transcript_17009/g.54057 Transcript_17009/m.54057 type:complete len:210 (+) Transcript_17009:260-889(+)
MRRARGLPRAFRAQQVPHRQPQRVVVLALAAARARGRDRAGRDAHLPAPPAVPAQEQPGPRHALQRAHGAGRLRLERGLLPGHELRGGRAHHRCAALRRPRRPRARARHRGRGPLARAARGGGGASLLAHGRLPQALRHARALAPGRAAAQAAHLPVRAPGLVQAAHHARLLSQHRPGPRLLRVAVVPHAHVVQHGAAPARARLGRAHH